MAVETPREDFTAMAAEWQRIREAIAGQTAMQSGAASYLRRPSGMSDKEWLEYVAAAPFYDATSRTVDGLTGMAFASDPIVTLPASLDTLREDMTLDGVALDGFAERLFEEVMIANRVGVLVDMPEKDETVRTRKDEEAQNIRPVASIYTAENIFHWTTAKVRGRRQLVEVRMFETHVTSLGDFEWSEEPRIRVLKLRIDEEAPVYEQMVFAPGKERGAAWVLESTVTPKNSGKTFDFIPFWFVNARDLTDALLKPPLLGLANANIAHFNTTAQYENALSFCGAPQPYIAGYQADVTEEFTIGSSNAWVIPGDNVTVGYLTIGSDGIAALEKRLTGFETQMAMLGARMLSPDKKGVEAAETAQIHRQGEVSVVIAACNRVSLALTEILRFMAEWMGQTVAKDAIVYRIQTNLFEQMMTGSEAVELVTLWQKGVIAYSDLLANLKRGKLVAASRTEEDIAAENQSGLITPAQLMLNTPPVDPA